MYTYTCGKIIRPRKKNQTTTKTNHGFCCCCKFLKTYMASDKIKKKSHNLLEFIKLYKHNPLQTFFFFILTIYQNYTLALIILKICTQLYM